MNLTIICRQLKNYFPPIDQKRDKSFIHKGTYTIENGSISPIEFVKENQYFRILNSALNDGVYQNSAADLASLEDEVFSGAIWVMNVPKSFISLCEEIEQFNAKVKELAAKSKGYSSESFAGYSYSLASGASGLGAGMTEWENELNRRLATYQKLSEL